MVATGDLLLGRYRVERYVARGGMGTVWSARDEVLDQPVAIKQVSFTSLDPDEARESRARTLREARIAARLRGHPQVVSLYDVTESEGDVWLVMEYLPSRSLAEVLDDVGALGPAETARIGAAVAGALAAAHARGVVHRDVKPGNVLIGGTTGAGSPIGADAVVKLTDFGISRVEGDQRVTATDVVSGTPAYMACEVARGEDPTAASDVFSLGSTLFRAVEGSPPFGQDPNSLRTMYRVAGGTMEPMRRAGPLEPLVRRLMATDPTGRPDAALARDLLTEVATRDPTADLRRPAAPGVRYGPWAVPAAPGPAAPGPAAPGPSAPVPPSATPTWTGPADARSASPPSGPPPGAWPPPESKRPPARRPWWRRTPTVVAAAVVVLALVAGLVVALLPGEDTATMPEAIGPVALSGDAGDADPCTLVDPTALDRFGNAGASQATSPLACDIRIDRADGGQALVSASFDLPPAAPDTAPGERQQVGAVTVIRSGPGPGTFAQEMCGRRIKLTDGSQVGVNAYVYRSWGVPACDLAESATVSAVRALGEDGVRYAQGRRSRFTFGRTDACTTLTGQQIQAAGVAGPVADGSPGPANWTCAWGSDSEVSLYFAVDGPTLSAYGTETATPAGDRAFLAPTATSCSAYVVHRVGGPSELVDVVLALPGRAGSDQCAGALSLAALAESRLPG